MLSKLGCIGCDRDGEVGGARGFQRILTIDEFFMKFINGDWDISSINQVNNSTVVFFETVSDDVKKIFMVKRGTKKSKLIGFVDDAAHILVDGFVAFVGLFELLFYLFDVATRWLAVGARESLPDFSRGSGSSNNRLNRERERKK